MEKEQIFYYVDKIFTKGRKHKRLVIKHEKGTTKIPFGVGVSLNVNGRHLFTFTEINCNLVGYHAKVIVEDKYFIKVELIDAWK